MYMYIYTHIYIYICVYIYICIVYINNHIYIYMYTQISKFLYPIWKYTHKGFPPLPTPPHAPPGHSVDGPGRGWGEVGGESLMGVFSY